MRGPSIPSQRGWFASQCPFWRERPRCGNGESSAGGGPFDPTGCDMLVRCDPLTAVGLPGRMLKKSTSRVLASFRPSTYRRGYASARDTAGSPPRRRPQTWRSLCFAPWTSLRPCLRQGASLTRRGWAGKKVAFFSTLLGRILHSQTSWLLKSLGAVQIVFPQPASSSPARRSDAPVLRLPRADDCRMRATHPCDQTVRW
ncbi:MAG: hypothetical protein K0S58_3055 [Nitrospira sp.]|nr:hypothetical protein [Nitrospira sp.]